MDIQERYEFIAKTLREEHLGDVSVAAIKRTHELLMRPKPPPPYIVKNRQFLVNHQRDYGFLVVTEKGLAPRAEDLKTSVYGRFIRVPLKSHVVWGFQTEEAMLKFRKTRESIVVDVNPLSL